MKKVSKLMTAALCALASFVPAQAETLTIYNGTAQSENIPIRATYFDYAPYRGQVIYPAAQLTAMVGENINSLKFYIANEDGNVMSGGKVALYLGTTTLDQYASGWSASFFEETDLTRVAEVSMTHGEAEVVFNFTEPWAYAGGNLVVATLLEDEGTYSNYGYFLGETTDLRSAAYGYYSPNTEGFYPKATFDYGESTPEPELIRGDVNGDKIVNISDVTTLIDMILQGDTAHASADCNQDTIVNISDVTALIDFILSGRWN